MEVLWRIYDAILEFPLKACLLEVIVPESSAATIVLRHGENSAAEDAMQPRDTDGSGNMDRELKKPKVLAMCMATIRSRAGVKRREGLNSRVRFKEILTINQWVSSP